jgi:hypothetical protein
MVQDLSTLTAYLDGEPMRFQSGDTVLNFNFLAARLGRITPGLEQIKTLGVIFNALFLRHHDGMGTAAAGKLSKLLRLHWVIRNLRMAELFNTSLETLCDRVTTAPDEAVRRVKDTAAGAVLIAALTAAGIGCLIFLPKLLALWGV